MAQINLAPGTMFIAAARRRQRTLYVGSVVIVVILLAVWLSLFVWERNLQQRRDTAAASLQKITAEITRTGDGARRIEEFEGRLLALDQLLENHVEWAPIFAELERLLPVATVLTQIDANIAQGTIAVRGKTPAVDIVAQTLASLRDTPTRATLFTDVNFSTLSREAVRDGAGAEVGARYAFGAAFKLK